MRDTGIAVALIVGPAQIVGLLAGGRSADKLARFDVRWHLRVPAIAMLVAASMFMMLLGVRSAVLALACLAIPLLIGGTQVSPVFAISRSLVNGRMRAVVSAVLIPIVSLVSGGVGPLAVGFVSNLLRKEFGEQSRKYSLLKITPIFSLWAALHYYLGSRHILADFKWKPR